MKKSLRSRTYSFIRQDGASTTVEFALVSGFLMFFVLIILSIALIEFLTQSIDYATQKAARQVMTGAVQNSQMTQAAFANLVCANLPVNLSCNDLIVNLYTIPYGGSPTAYYNYTVNGDGSGLLMPTLSSTSAVYSPGIQGNYEYLMIVYPVTFFPSVFSSILGQTTYKGAPAYPIVATSAFRNEQY